MGGPTGAYFLVFWEGRLRSRCPLHKGLQSWGAREPLGKATHRALMARSPCRSALLPLCFSGHRMPVFPSSERRKEIWKCAGEARWSRKLCSGGPHPSVLVVVWGQSRVLVRAQPTTGTAAPGGSPAAELSARGSSNRWRLGSYPRWRGSCSVISSIGFCGHFSRGSSPWGHLDDLSRAKAKLPPRAASRLRVGPQQR